MNAKQEILDALGIAREITRCAYIEEPLEGVHTGLSLRDAFDAITRIREILSKHTLEPIDDRPFDPTMCGFREENGQLVKGDGEFFIENNMGCLELWALGEDEPLIRIAKWPVAHSLMERLLKLLGVLGDG